MAEERRNDPRFPFSMKAYPLDGGEGHAIESVDLSASGAYFLGDPGAQPGERVWVRIELTTMLQGRPSLFPLDAEVEIVRLSRAAEGSVEGFGARWVAVGCAGDVAPLRHFLKAVLSIGAGFLQSLSPGDDGGPTRYAYLFPTLADPDAIPAARGPRTPPRTDADAGLQVARTGVYVMMPLTFVTDEGEFEGRAVKLLPHGMRIATAESLPEAYRRVTVRIPVKHRDKASVVSLGGTVTTVRRGSGDSQFEVELSLGNDPDAIAGYRRILEAIAESLRARSPV